MTAAAVVSSEALGCTFRKLQLSEQYFRRELLPLVEVSSPRVSQCRPADRDGDERLSLSRLAELSLALAPGCLSAVGSLQSALPPLPFCSSFANVTYVTAYVPGPVV